MRVFAGTRTSLLIVGGAFVLFAVVAVIVGTIRDDASARAARQADAAALAATQLLDQTTIATVHRSVVVPSSFRSSNTYGDRKCDEYQLGCWTTSEAPIVAAKELRGALAKADFVVLRAACKPTGDFCEVIARVGQARINYWVTVPKASASGSAASHVTEIAGYVSP